MMWYLHGWLVGGCIGAIAVLLMRVIRLERRLAEQDECVAKIAETMRDLAKHHSVRLDAHRDQLTQLRGH